MVSVFISHSSKDKPFARELADFLGREGDIKVWLDEREIAPGNNIVSNIEKGLDSDFVCLILSPDSVDSAWVKEEWTDAFWEQTNARTTKLFGVLYRDCKIPRLLRNKSYVDLRNNHPEGFRKIRTFLLTGKPAEPTRVNQLPVRPPLFIGRVEELAQLRERLRKPGELVYISEMPGRGKTTLALEFAHRYQTDFEAVYWLPCESGSLASISAELARLLGLKLEGDTAQIMRELKGFCAGKRCLLILDNVEDESPGELIPGGAACVLVTTRKNDLKLLRGRHPLKLPLFTDDHCFELFRDQLGDEQVAKHEDECRRLFKSLDHLPIGVSLCAALIREDPGYTIGSLARNLPADATALIKRAIETLDPASRRLLEAMAACAPEGFALDLAAEIAGLDETASVSALRPVYVRSLVEELDRDERRYRLHSLVRAAAADGASLAKKHAEAVQRRFEHWEKNWQRCEQDLPDFRVALDWALSSDLESKPSFHPRTSLQDNFAPRPSFLARALAYSGYRLTHRTGHLSEALEICQRLGCRAELSKDHRTQGASYGNQALILKTWGRLDEALKLHKKEEAVCLKLGDKNGLQASYGNQALILRVWGRLDEALELLKKKEAICLELGNKDSLQMSYGNQALILKANGRLDEALELLKKQDAICLELENKDSLQMSYGNQAVILKANGRLDEALVLHKKEEAICQELGYRDGLQVCYGNQALILQDWGRLDEALVLHKKQEAICLELGNKAGLGICYANWGLLERAYGHRDAERGMLLAALKIFTELKMPLERDAVHTELDNTDAPGTS